MQQKPTSTEPLTFETVWASIQESNRYLTEKFAETDRQFKETERIFKEQNAKTWIQINENSKNIGGISNSNGEVAEEYFTNNITQDLQFAGQEFDSFTPNLKKRVKKLNLKGEFDLVLYNCTSVAIIEIKYKARKEHVETLLKKPQIFKQLFPEYANNNIYLGLAGLTVEDNAETEAKAQGIAIIKQVGENMVVIDDKLKVF